MRSIHSIRVLTVVSLAIALLVAPVVTHAAPRFDPEGTAPSLVAQAWDWVSSLWGAGGGGWDPTSVRATAPVASPAPAVSDDARSASRPARNDRARRVR